MSTLASRVRTSAAIAREDARDFVRNRIASAPEHELDARQQRALTAVRSDGFAVIEGYWPRERALAMRDRLELHLEAGRDRDFECGSYLRFQDDEAYDQGVRRLFHVERLVPELAAFRQDQFVLELASAYYRMPFHSGLLLFQYNTRSNDNTRYFHVDSFAKEFKAFLYLDDVDTGNGPFTYLRGSHKRHLKRLAKQISGNANDAATSFSPGDVGALLGDEVPVCGPAGTLILSDVRGLHRGSPQLDRSRSVLVNYITRHQRDLYPARDSAHLTNENSVPRSETQNSA